MAKTIKNVAKCPHCGQPHAYSEVRFTGVNDNGYWTLTCRSCAKNFVIPLMNPVESGASFCINQRHTDQFQGDHAELATDIVAYDLGETGIRHYFDYEAAPLYICPASGENVERRAKAALTSDFKAIKAQYANAVNYALATHTAEFRHIIVQVEFGDCPCGAEHLATFYAPFAWSGTIQQRIDEYPLAGVTRTDLCDRLEGLFSKTEIMGFLEKLFIRWHLTSNQVVVAVPFVGHQYLSKEKKLSLWTWLLSLLDPELAVFITRKTTLDGYKQVLEDVDGLKFSLLESYGLANKLIAADTRKQDFHAKFYIGISNDGVEVLSGSANLVKGSSIENISFGSMCREKCNNRFLIPLNVKLPDPRKPAPFVKIYRENGEYVAKPAEGAPFATNG